MPPIKLSDFLAREILRLHGQGLPSADIATQLGLKKMQVTSLVAHHNMREDLTESVVDAEYSEPKSVIEQHARAEQSEDVDVADESISGIYVGDDKEYGDAQQWVPWDSREVQNPHLMIIGESGSGKTYAAQCLVAELARHRIPSVIFDYGQSFELENLEREFSGFVKPREYLIGEEGLALNPLQIFPKDVQGPNAVASRISDVFDAVYRLGDIQRKVLIDAILNSFEKAGVRASDRTTWQSPAPSLTSLYEELETMSSDKEYANYKNAAGVTARLTTFFMLNSLRTDREPWSWQEIIEGEDHRVHILQFRGLEGKTQRVVIELLLWHLFFFLKAEGQNPLRLYCVLDEAHHLSFRDGGPVDSILREARKFGLGLIFASQQPEDFSPAAFSNSASKLVFQTTDPTLRVSKLLSQKCRNLDDPKELHDLISVLPQGEAFFITKNVGHVVRIADLKKRTTLWTQQ